MGLFRSIPLIERELKFLQEVNFTELQIDLEQAQKVQSTSVKDNDSTEEQNKLITKFPRIVGIQPMLDKLCLNLEPATSSGVYITGARECGKTTLVEALIRARAMEQLSSHLGTKPFYIFDATGFFLQTKSGDRIQLFTKALKIVAESNGLLIIDHLDDFVEMAGSDGTLLLNALVSTLEQYRRRGMVAIVLAEETGIKEVAECGKSLQRVFKHFPINQEPSFEELKPILTAKAAMLGKAHNVKFTESAIDEVIRILSRYPGRTFTAAKPGNAIEFLDMVGAHVSRIRFAEPISITEMRNKISVMHDEYNLICRESAPEIQERATLLKNKLEELTAQFQTEEAEWREKFQPLESTRKLFATIERELPILRLITPASPQEKLRIKELIEIDGKRSRDEDQELSILKAKRPRTPGEEAKFNLYTNNYDKAKEDVKRAEEALYSSAPLVQAEHARAVFNAQTGFSIKSPAETRERLKTLDGYLAGQIFRQEQARIALANAYRARERGVKDPSKPTVLLFGGGSGLGKTELVKALVRYHLGMENKPDLADQLSPITISLSEFGDKSSVSKLIGAAPGLVGYDEAIPWHDEIRKDPRAIVLFDEADKAHPLVLLTLMQAFEEGILKDSAQRPINLKDTIIVVNINGVTADDIQRRDDPDHIFEQVLKVQSESGGTLFTKAVLNRIDGIYIFDNLREEDLVKITRKEIRKLNGDFREQAVSINLDDQTALAILKKHTNQSAGGRWPRKLVQSMIRPKILNYIDQRDNNLKAGEVPTPSTLTINFDEDEISISANA